MSNVQSARINKTLLFFKERQTFLDMLWKEIESSIKSATRKAMTPCFRLNLTSDLPFHKIKTLVKLFLMRSREFSFTTTLQTRRGLLHLAGELPSNYHLTFSRKEDNESLAILFCQWRQYRGSLSQSASQKLEGQNGCRWR